MLLKVLLLITVRACGCASLLNHSYSNGGPTHKGEKFLSYVEDSIQH